MELIKIFLTKLIKDSAFDDKVFRRNLLKNYLQIQIVGFFFLDLTILNSASFEKGVVVPTFSLRESIIIGSCI